MNAVASQQRIGRGLDHDAVRLETIEFIALDDGAAGVFGDDSHASTAAYAIAAHHRAAAHQLHRHLVRVEQLIAFHRHQDIGRENADAFFGEAILADADRSTARIGVPAHGPNAGVAIFVELILDDAGIAIRSGETHADAVIRKAVALDQYLAGILRNVHADIAGLDRGRLQPKMLGTQQDARRLAIANVQALDGHIGTGDVEDRASRQCGCVDLGAWLGGRETNATRTHERRQGGGERYLRHSHGNGGLALGRCRNEQRFAQGTGAAVAAIGDVDCGTVGGLAGFHLARFIPKPKQHEDAEYGEDAHGDGRAATNLHGRLRQDVARRTRRARSA